MDFAETFSEIGAMVVGVKSRRQKSNEEFLALLRKIVETVPLEVVHAFGNLENVALYDPKGKPTTAGIELTVADYMWWKAHLAKGNRFRWGVGPVKDYMLGHLAKQAEAGGLEPKERKALLALVAA